MKLLLWAPLLGFVISTHAESLGVFEKAADIGKTTKAGSATVDPSANSYVVSGGGENMWFTNDAFHFVWKRVSGDFALEAAMAFVGTGGNAHRKACLLVRQSLAPDSPYVDVAVHGDGLTSLQFRESPGGQTHEIQIRPSNPGAASPSTLGIEREAETFFATLPTGQTSSAQALSPAGAFIRLKFTDPVYVGLGVCAHDDRVLETARFSQVELKSHSANPQPKPVLHCALEIVPIGSKDRRVVYHTQDHIEAPNWSRDGHSLVFNSGGHLYRLPVTGGRPAQIDTGSAVRCNNDHGFSPDGTQLAISDQTSNGKSLIYIVPATGGTPRQVTTLGPSYWHGWSPDGSTLAYCADRDGEFDVYTIPAIGGEEKRLTTAKGLDDGPEYSPDGKVIYFNSDRTGTMQIWRMKPDGSEQEQVTSDDLNNWFAHPSPDGKWLVFLSFEKDVTGHPPNKPVRLRLMPTAGGPIQELARLFGGQGTINVPSWSPDSRQVAFVSYELLSR
jgi:TolB protein